MIAVVTVTDEGWQATVVAHTGETANDAPSDDWLHEHMRPAVHLQACRGGGVFVAAIPVEATTP